MNFVKLLKNKVLIYLVSRYFVYGIQFLTSIIVAAKLGAYYMGIWGFVLLMINYFSQIHLGIANALNVLLIQHNDNEEDYNEYVWNALIANALLILAVLLFYIYYLVIGIEDVVRYHADAYVIPICLIAIFQYYNGIFNNIFRVKNRLNCISFCQSIVVILPFLCLPFFEGQKLVDILVGCYFVGTLISVIYSLFKGIIPRFKISFFKYNKLLEIFKKGIYLFLYNSCFAFIVISIRTIVSSNYSVDNFGKFTFAFTLANAVMMLMDAFSFIAFPKVLSVLANKDNQEVSAVLKKYHSIYVVTANLVMYVFLLLMPVLTILMPQYVDSIPAFNIIGLALLMNAHNFLISSFLIARNQENFSAKISAIGLVLNVFVALMLVKIFKVDYNLVALAMLFSYFIMTYVTYRKCVKTICLSITDIFSIRMIIPYSMALLLSIFSFYNYLWLPLLLFLLLNYRDVYSLKIVATRLLKNSNIINI